MFGSSKILSLLLKSIDKSVINVSRLSIGSLWYVKLPKATGVIKVEVVEFTHETVLLKFVEGRGGESRYHIRDIKFIEELDGTEKV